MQWGHLPLLLHCPVFNGKVIELLCKARNNSQLISFVNVLTNKDDEYTHLPQVNGVLLLS